jgi:adenylosuccinate synthase
LHQDLGEKLQQIGREFGVTTGRKRRCGWLDLVVVKYSHMINHFTSLALMKLDILDTFDEIKVGVDYKLAGKSLPSFPADQSILKNVDVEYMTFPGWKQSIEHCSAFEELPVNAQYYVKTIEKYLGVRIQWIGVGPSREQIIQVF